MRYLSQYVWTTQGWIRYGIVDVEGNMVKNIRSADCGLAETPQTSYRCGLLSGQTQAEMPIAPDLPILDFIAATSAPLTVGQNCTLILWQGADLAKKLTTSHTRHVRLN